MTEQEDVTAQDDDRIIWSSQELRMLKYMLTHDGIQFFRYFFKHREGNAAVLNWHHFIIDYVLELVLSNKINRLIINLPPGYTKTCLLYTSPSPRDGLLSRMPSSA